MYFILPRFLYMTNQKFFMRTVHFILWSIMYSWSKRPSKKELKCYMLIWIDNLKFWNKCPTHQPELVKFCLRILLLSKPINLRLLQVDSIDLVYCKSVFWMTNIQLKCTPLDLYCKMVLNIYRAVTLTALVCFNCSVPDVPSEENLDAKQEQP